jgi:hypothetical protein
MFSCVKLVMLYHYKRTEEMHYSFSRRLAQRLILRCLLRYRDASVVTGAFTAKPLQPTHKFCLRAKKIWSDGTSSVVFEPSEFLERLAAIIPRPEKNLVIYRGVLAPNHKLRKAVVAYGREPTNREVTPAIEQTQLDIFARLQAEARPESYSAALSDPPVSARSNPTWASLMRRALEQARKYTRPNVC